LLLCSSYLPLGVLNWTVTYIINTMPHHTPPACVVAASAKALYFFSEIITTPDRGTMANTSSTNQASRMPLQEPPNTDDPKAPHRPLLPPTPAKETNHHHHNVARQRADHVVHLQGHHLDILARTKTNRHHYSKAIGKIMMCRRLRGRRARWTRHLRTIHILH
jgi:hypothetical protein